MSVTFVNNHPRYAESSETDLDPSLPSKVVVLRYFPTHDVPVLVWYDAERGFERPQRLLSVILQTNVPPT